MEEEFKENPNLQKCRKCNYAIVLRKYWENEFKQKKATIIIRTVTVCLSIQTIIVAILRKVF